MAKKGKIKISRLKRNNHTTNKMRKRGELNLQRHKIKIQKQKPPSQPQVEYSSESEGSGDEWADMLDEDEKKYIMGRIATQARLFTNVSDEVEEPKTNNLKRKRSQSSKKVKSGDSGAESGDSDLEDKYEKDVAERPVKKTRQLLPIKTKEGIQERTEEYEDLDTDMDDIKVPKKLVNNEKQTESDLEQSESDSGIDGAEVGLAQGEMVTAVQLMAARRDKLNNDKLRIGALCSSLLESPDKKLKNLFPILYLMEERLKDNTLNLHSVRKIATLSAFEVFKDILPEYYLRHQDYSNIKLKKDTLYLYKHEKELLEFYKRYLQRLEKACSILRRKKGDTRKPDESMMDLAIVSLRCMCGLLVARSNFNFATNIAQSVVPFLDSKNTEAIKIVTECCINVFADDMKGDITLTIVRLINQLVKRREERLNPSALDCLLSLKIRDVDLDAQADVQAKKKTEEKHKKRIVNLSKKEKKRAKKLKEVEHELLETEAHESEISRKKQMTEVIKTVFHIYFRLLKQAPTSKLLSAALNGLAKFTHCINLDYYTDLVAILSRLISEEMIGSRERLLCVRTALCILASTGDALNIDPAKLHHFLYKNTLEVHAGRSHEDARVIIEAVTQICARARRVSAAVLQALAKRVTTLSLQIQHNGALACLVTLQKLAEQSKPVSSLFEPDFESGSGRFDPELDSPEHCNAQSATLHELCLLKKHYHPTVRATATSLLRNLSLPSELVKLTSLQALNQYDGSQMAFKPSIPPPQLQTSKKLS